MDILIYTGAGSTITAGEAALAVIDLKTSVTEKIKRRRTKT